MIIVQVEDFFHPEAGYQVNILSKYLVNEGHTVHVITAQMDIIPDNLTGFFGKENIEEKDRKYTEQTGVNIIRIPIKSYISGRVVFTNRIYKEIKTLKPDILYIHGNDTLTGIRFLFNHRRLKYPMILDSHMLEIASVNKLSKLFRLFYKLIVTPIIIKSKIKVIRTQDDTYVEKCLGIPLCQCPYIPLGSDTLLFHPDELVKKDFRKEYNISDSDFVILYTGKLDEAKGGKLLADTFMEKFNTKKNIVLIVVGSSFGEYGNEVERKFTESENRILRFSTQKYVDLARFYQSADVSVFPKQCSLSFYDAQACGLPVVSEDNNINIDRLKYSNGFTFQAGNKEDFRSKIINLVEMEDTNFIKMKNNAYNYIKNNFDYEKVAKKYINLLQTESY